MYKRLTIFYIIGNVGQAQVILVVFGMAQGRRLGVGLALLFSDIRLAQDSESFCVRGHHTVLDAIVDHLHEVPRAVGTAVKIAQLRRAVDVLASWRW